MRLSSEGKTDSFTVEIHADADADAQDRPPYIHFTRTEDSHVTEDGEIIPVRVLHAYELHLRRGLRLNLDAEPGVLRTLAQPARREPTLSTGRARADAKAVKRKRSSRGPLTGVAGPSACWQYPYNRQLE